MNPQGRARKSRLKVTRWLFVCLFAGSGLWTLLASLLQLTALNGPELLRVAGMRSEQR